MNERLATKEELEMIRDAIMLPFIMDVVQRNIDKLNFETWILKPLYIEAGEKLLDHIQKHLAEIKKELRRRDIKVWEDRHADHILHYKYVCRGYHDTFGIMREVMKAEMSVRLTQYMRKLFQK